MSAADGWRAVCARNTAACALRVQALLLRAHDGPAGGVGGAARRAAGVAGPFRLLLEFCAPAPRCCRCDADALPDELRTGITLLLVSDVGEPSQVNR